MHWIAHLLEPGHGLPRLRSDDVGQGERSGKPPVDEHENDGLALGREALDPRIRHFDAVLPQIARAHDLDVLPVDAALGAPARHGLEFLTEGASLGPAATMPLAMGCSEWASTDAAYRTRASSSIPASKARMSVTPNRPSVSVPVLSKMMAWIFRALSKAARSLMRRPFVAEIAVETATTRGTASPRA